MPRDLFEVYKKEPRDLLESSQDVSRGLSGQSPANYAFLEKIANSIPVNFVLGAGDAVRNNAAHLANLVPGMNIPIVKSGEGGAYTAGEIGGDIASFLAGGSGLMAGRAALEGAPLIGKLASELGKGGARGVARRAIGTGAYGAVTNPEERGKAALKDTLMSAGLDVAIPGGAKLLKAGKNAALGKLNNFFNPDEVGKEILSYLGAGQNRMENLKSLSQLITGKYSDIRREANDLFNSFFDRYSPSIRLQLKGSSYGKLADKAIDDKYFTHETLKAHELFKQNPTLTNAHTLQSKIDKQSRKLEKYGNPSSTEDSFKQAALLKAREALLKQMDNTLGKEGAAEYEGLRDWFFENVVPYSSKSAIHKAATDFKKGKHLFKDVGKLPGAFSEPGIEVMKVANDLGEEGLKRIILSQTQKVLPSNLTSRKLLESFEDMGRKGYGEYITPQLQKQIAELSKRLNRKTFGQKIGGLALGLVGGGTTGSKVLQGASGIAGALLAPSFVTAIKGDKSLLTSPSKGGNGALYQLLTNLYPSLKLATKAHLGHGKIPVSEEQQ